MEKWRLSISVALDAELNTADTSPALISSTGLLSSPEPDPIIPTQKLQLEQTRPLYGWNFPLTRSLRITGVHNHVGREMVEVQGRLISCRLGCQARARLPENHRQESNEQCRYDAPTCSLVRHSHTNSQRERPLAPNSS